MLLNEIVDHYNNHELEACFQKANELLDDDAAPRYHRMRSRIILAKVLGDWNEANECYIKVESMWRITRRSHEVGEDAGIDESLEELRIALQELRELLDADEDKPKEYDAEKDVTARVNARDEAVADEKARITDEDPEELRKADEEVKEALHKTDEEEKMALRPKIERSEYVKGDEVDASDEEDEGFDEEEVFYAQRLRDLDALKAHFPKSSRVDFFKEHVAQLKSRKGALPQSLPNILTGINARVRGEDHFSPEEALGILWQLRDEFPITVG